MILSITKIYLMQLCSERVTNTTFYRFDRKAF